MAAGKTRSTSASSPAQPAPPSKRQGSGGICLGVLVGCLAFPGLRAVSQPHSLNCTSGLEPVVHPHKERQGYRDISMLVWASLCQHWRRAQQPGSRSSLHQIAVVPKGYPSSSGRFPSQAGWKRQGRWRTCDTPLGAPLGWESYRLAKPSCFLALLCRLHGSREEGRTDSGPLWIDVYMPGQRGHG